MKGKLGAWTVVLLLLMAAIGKEKTTEPQLTERAPSLITRLRRLLRKYPIVEFVVLVLYPIPNWLEWLPVEPGKQPGHAMAANSVSNAVGGALTAATIMLSATLIGLRAAEPPPEVWPHVRWAVLDALISVLAGLLVLALLPRLVEQYDVSTHPDVNTFAALQLSLVGLAAWRIVCAVWSALPRAN